MPEDDETRVRSRPGRRWAMVVLAGLTLVSALSFAGGPWWVLDLLSHFHAIYFWMAVVLGVVMAALRWWPQVTWAGALVAFEALLLLPLHASVLGTEPSRPESPRLRVVSYNMLHSNPRTPEAAAHIAALEPDVVVLLELTAEQLPVFMDALPGWHQVSQPRQDAFGIAVLTREAPTHVERLDLGADAMPAFALGLVVGGRDVTLAAMHPPPPVSARLSHTRDRMLRAISAWAADRAEPVVVVGDLNATPWSAVMREILREGPLRSTERFGLQATWPSFLGALGVPIDHALVAGAIEAVDRRIEPAFGSDHRMLLVELALR